MNKFLPILLCLVAGLTSASVSAQELYPARGDSRVERARGDADDARRRETDVTGQIVGQERANATIRDQLRRLASDPAGLQMDLVDVSEQAAALRKKVTEQRRHRDAAEDRLNEARGRALEQYEQTGPMKAARNSAEDAAAELDRLSQPILELLGQNPGYQDAQALVDAAAQAGEALQGFDNVDPKAQAEADAAFDQAMSRVREIEDAAIDADPKAAEAHKSLKIAQDMLEGLRMENEKKIATNPAVDAARFALDLEQKLLDDSSADLGTAEKRLSALRQTTQPNAGPPTELSNQLKEGEGRLRDLNDQLDQARIARQDADDRLRFIEGAVAGGRPAAAGEPYPPAPSDYPPGTYEEPYSGGGYYDSGGYGYSYGGYPAYGYRPYHRSFVYDPFYCPPYYGAFVDTGFFFGASYYSRPYYHSYYRPYYYTSNYHRFHDDSWRRRYDYWRGGGDGRSRDGRLASANRRYDYARFDRNEIARDRNSRSSIDRARLAPSDSERDYRYRTGISTYNYPGSTVWRQRERESASLRASQYESAARERRAVAEDDARRAGISIEPSRSSSSSSGSRLDASRDRTSAELRSERASAEDARRREASDSASRSRTEWRPRTSADETRGTRPNEDYGRSRSSSSSSDSSATARRDGSSDSAPSRGRSIDAPPPSASPSRGSSRGSDSPPPPSSSGRGSSRGGGGGDSSPPPSSSGRGSFRSDSGPSSGGSSRGSARGGDSSPPPSAPSRGSSSSGASSRGGGGSSSSSNGSARGR